MIKKTITCIIAFLILNNSIIQSNAFNNSKSDISKVEVEEEFLNINSKILKIEENKDIEYIKLSNGTIINDNKLNMVVNNNGSYEFEIKFKDNKETLTKVKTITDIKKSYLITPKEEVLLRLNSQDDLSGIDKMRFKNDNGEWSSYEPYNSSRNWRLDSSEGLKTVYAMYKDVAGNETVEVFDKIILDKSGPTISKFVINNNDAYTNKTNVKLNITATDNYSNVEKLLISNDNKTWVEKKYSTEIDWVLDTTVGMKTVFIKGVDSSGNIGVTTSDTIYLDTILPTGAITINNNSNITNSKNVELTLSFDDLHSKVKRVTIIEKDKSYTFPTLPSSPTKLNWTLSHGNTGKVTLEIEDNAGNVYRTDSNEIVIATLEITEFKLTNVVNPSIFNNNNPFKPVIWSFEPQPMKSGANISFETKYSLELDNNTTADVKGDYVVDIISEGYNKSIKYSYEELKDNVFKATVKIPSDAPTGAKVYITTTVDAKLTNNNETIDNKAIFPGSNEKALIGVIDGNIKEDVIFNEIS